MEQLSRKEYLRTRVSPDKNNDKTMNLKQRTITACIKSIFYVYTIVTKIKKNKLYNNKTNYKNVLTFWCVK